MEHIIEVRFTIDREEPPPDGWYISGYEDGHVCYRKKTRTEDDPHLSTCGFDGAINGCSCGAA